MLTDTRRRSNNVKIRLSGPPDLIQINDALMAVSARPGNSQRFSWYGKDCEFRLTVLAPARGAAPSWQLDTVRDGQSQSIWAHSSCDVPLIHNLIISACGHAAKLVETDGLMAASSAYRHVSKKHDLYFAKNQTNFATEDASAAVAALKDVFASVKAGLAADQGTAPPKNKHQAAIEKFKNEIKNADTLLYTPAAMLFFLEQEYYRSYRTRAPLSFLLLRAKIVSSSGCPAGQSLTATQVRTIAQRIDRVKRHLDFVGHYHGEDMAILLPNTNASTLIIELSQRVSRRS